MLGVPISFLQQTMHRLLIQPSYSIEDIHLVSINQNQNHFGYQVAKTGDPTIPDEDASAGNLLHVYGAGLLKRIRLEEYSCY